MLVSLGSHQQCSLPQLQCALPLFVVSAQGRSSECYCTMRRGGSSRTASKGRSGLCWNVNWLLGLKGMNRKVLEGTVSFNARAAVSNRTIKISASITTTLGLRQPNTRRREVTPFPPKNCDRQHRLSAVGLLRRLRRAQLLQQRLGFLQIARVETFSEPAIHGCGLGRKDARLAVRAPRAREAHCGTELL